MPGYDAMRSSRGLAADALFSELKSVRPTMTPSATPYRLKTTASGLPENPKALGIRNDEAANAASILPCVSKGMTLAAERGQSVIRDSANRNEPVARAAVAARGLVLRQYRAIPKKKAACR